jgi:hypothetical protein
MEVEHEGINPHEIHKAAPPEKEEILYTWQAPLRPFKKRDKEFFTTVIAIAVLMSLILFFIEGLLPVVVIFAIVFLVYVLSTVPPEEIEHKITNKGVFFAGNRYEWDDLKRFWFAHRFGTELLVIDALRAPWRIEMVIGEGDKKKIQDTLEKHLLFEEASPSFLDKAAVWLSRRVNLEQQ